MMICPKCGKELEDESKFCANCGTKISKTVFCANCGKEMNPEDDICPNCGKSQKNVEEIKISAAESSGAEVSVKAQPPKKKFSKNQLIMGGSGVILLVVLFIAVSMLLSTGSSSNYALYFKDNELTSTDLKRLEPKEVSENFCDAIENDGQIPQEYAGLYSLLIQVNKEKDIIFYPDNMNYGDYKFSLYYRSLNKDDAGPEKIDSDVVKYQANDSADLVTYIKGDEGTLYQNDLTNKEKIASNVSFFAVSDDGKKIIYLDTEGSAYLKIHGKDKEKIDSNIYLEYISDDMSILYYTKDDVLYRKQEGKDKEKISSDVAITMSFQDNSAYFLKASESEISLLDYVEDDLAQSDLSVTRPESPRRPYSFYYDSYEEYKDAIRTYNDAYDKYNADYQTYRQKLSRDELRSYLKGTKKDTTNYTLCYYDGKEVVEVSDKIILDSNFAYASEKAAIIYRTYNPSEVPKIKLSEINSIYDVENKVDEALYSSSKLFVALGGSSTEIEQTESRDYVINDSGTTAYYFDDYSDDDSYGDLYQISITDKGVQKPVLYDSEVSLTNPKFLDDNTLLYYKDVNSNKGDLYINKKNIDYDAYLYQLNQNSDSNIILYYTDWDTDNDVGTLKLYDGKNVTKIADDVHSSSFSPNGNILYIDDYSLKYGYGELKLYQDGKDDKTIDDEVSAILTIYDNLKKRGF